MSPRGDGDPSGPPDASRPRGETGRGDASGPGAPEDVLSAVLARMAHQIKNPLQAVTMNLEVIRLRVRREVPELWETLERFAGAVDENVERLNRRLELLLQLGRPGEGGEPIGVELATWTRELVTALGLDEERPPVRVESDGTAGARIQPGPLAELLFRLLRWLRAEADPEGVRLVVERGPEGEALLRTTAGPGDPEERVGACRWERWNRLARAAGGRLEVVPRADGERRLVLRLPSA